MLFVMCYFTKKMEYIFFTITVFLLIISTALVAFSNSFIPWLYHFFSDIVFHREFSIDKWLPTLQSFIIIPIFITIFLNVIVFHKHSDSFKFFYCIAIVACIAFIVTFTVASSMQRTINSDLAAETLLARECLIEKSPVPIGWCYSTEIRLLNTQLISAPLFMFISNWDIVRALTSLISCAILFWSCWFLLEKIGIKKQWLKFLGGALISCPWSRLHFYVIGWGNYYIPHIVLGFITLALFISIITERANNKKISIILFYCIAFISGISTIRYILIYQFPLVLTMSIISYKNQDKKDITLADIKSFFYDNKNLWISIVALFISGVGYLFNNSVLHRLYKFSQWNDVAFNHFGDVPIQNILTTIITAFGYQENIAVFTPSGVINLCVYVAIVFFIVNMVVSIKREVVLEKKIVLIFTVCTIAFNTFLYFSTEFISRYYIPVMAYMIPCLIIFIENNQIGIIKRYIVACSFTICIFVNSFTATQYYLTSDANKLIYPVMDFLINKQKSDSDYSFGYSTPDFSTEIVYFSKEKIKVAPIKKVHIDGKNCIPNKYIEALWLTPKSYNEIKTDGKVFFMTSQELFENSINNTIFEAGELVFNDGNYRVYEFENQNKFKESFGEK